jgi:hypothetical protein
MTWKKGGTFLSTENPDNIVIFHLLGCPLFFQEFTFLGGYSRGIFSKQKSFKNRDKVIEKFIKTQGIFVPPQCLVPKGHRVKFTIHLLANRQFRKLIAICYHKYQIRGHNEFIFFFVL